MVAMRIKTDNCNKTCNNLYLIIILAKVDYWPAVTYKAVGFNINK